MRFFSIYQYVAPAIAVPLAYWLWLARFAGDRSLAMFMIVVPVTFAYVIPAIGMNVLKIWSMKTRFRLGRIRPHHGLVFGSASSLFGLLSLDPLRGQLEWYEPFRAALTLGAVIGFWNWLYDIVAMKVGFIEVYNRPYANNEGAEAIVTDYAPQVFGGFGLVYGFWMRLAEYYLFQQGRADLYWPMLICAMFTAVTVPVLIFVAYAMNRYGDPSLRAFSRSSSDGTHQ